MKRNAFSHATVLFFVVFHLFCAEILAQAAIRTSVPKTASPVVMQGVCSIVVHGWKDSDFGYIYT